MIVSCLSFLSAARGGEFVLFSILSIVFCALVMHGLKTMNHKLIMPALIFIPISSIGIVIALIFTLVVAGTVTAVCTQDTNYYGQSYSYSTSCNDTAAGIAGVVLAVAFTLLAIAAGIWIAAWISFYKAYKYIMQSIRNNQTQQVPLQPQQGMAPQPQQGYPPQGPQQGYPPQPQQGFAPQPQQG